MRINEAGNIVQYNGVEQRFNYDPWGRRRNPTDWSYENIPTENLFARGFTGHEHIDQFGIINMNRRVYDPIMGTFLSPDNYVHNLQNSQTYNRYSYCWNNPMLFTDPDGEHPLIILGMALAGAYMGGTAMNDGELNPGKWDFNKPETWLGMGFGAIIGSYGGYAMVTPGYSLHLTGKIVTPLVSIGIAGHKSDWSFQWTTPAGGEGDVTLSGDGASGREQSNEKIINKINSSIQQNKKKQKKPVRKKIPRIIVGMPRQSGEEDDWSVIDGDPSVGWGVFVGYDYVTPNDDNKQRLLVLDMYLMVINEGLELTYIIMDLELVLDYR